MPSGKNTIRPLKKQKRGKRKGSKHWGGIAQLKPRNLSEYLQFVEAIQQKAGHAVWFRGCGQASTEQLPSLYRHPTKTNPADLIEVERQLMVRFRQRSIPYHSRNLTDDWDAIFFMQHYGVPTRLLDWTENPLVALHFALMSAPSKTKKNRTTYAEPATVWILDPVGWNRAALKHISYKGGPLTPGDEALKGYSPSAAAAGLSQFPIALFGAHNSARIVAQQGVFTIFGSEAKPMEQIARRPAFSPSPMSKIVILPSRIASMRRSLLNQGITESAVYPDLDGLAKETKRHFGFTK